MPSGTTELTPDECDHARPALLRFRPILMTTMAALLVAACR